jgi:hypothetical protein
MEIIRHGLQLNKKKRLIMPYDFLVLLFRNALYLLL